MISAVVLTRNEENNIADCLKSLTFCDEILLIDDNSIDNTVNIAKKLGAKVYQHDLQNDFAQQRNFALTKTSGDWILFVDADERVSSQLKEEILQKIKTNSSEGYYVKRYDFLWGKMLSHGEIGTLRLLRLLKKGTGIWKGQVHEIAAVKGKTEVLKNPLLHYPHPQVTDFLDAINVYSTIRANELFEKSINTNWTQIIIYPLGKFIQNYIFRLGLLDGTQGFVFATIMSFHSFLVRGKLWLLLQKK